MSLIALQRDFRAWLDTASDEAAARMGPQAAAGLLVYQNNYRAALMACLADTFERVRAWIGEDAFEAAAIAHIRTHPPHAWTLDAYAEGFPDSIAALWPHDPEVGELAWIDGALAEAFVAPDADPVAMADLGAIDWDNAVLRFSPSIALAPAASNAAAIWSALSAGETPPAAARLPIPGATMVWRQDGMSCFRSIETVERLAIDHAMSGASFGALCAMLVDSLGEAEGAAQAGALLGQWLRDGLIVGVN
ncbi:MAG: DUF2063 domain-containing protein [Sphingomonas sanxanigenens]|uniref:DUF2063 domain-containing protein n=1 Tax=Sphingomonas sanxanigenens TaxID=397260 RepID=A0A2W5ACI0_9SPHN|nr:MAG: DUF2063 domain-containing protein [Sphingomonas sanxanigenens]